MTIATATCRQDYTGNGSTTTFSTSSFAIFNTDTLSVFVVTNTTTGEYVTLVENTDYTVTGGAGAVATVDLAGGSSPFGAPSASMEVVLLRAEPYLQADDFVNNSASDAEVLEDRLDKITMQVQQLLEQLDRTFKLPEVEAGTVTKTQIPYDRASTYLGFDADKLLVAVDSPLGLVGSSTVTVGGIVVTGSATVGGTLTVTGATTLAAVTVTGLGATDITVTGQAVINTLSVTGPATVAGLGATDITVTGQAVINTLSVTGPATMAGAVVVNGLISPSQITANQNDYAPTGVATAFEIRVDSDADRAITGLSASQVEGRKILITNDGAFTITLNHEDANSTAANRFDLGADNNLAIEAGATALLSYDGTASRWRVIGGSALGVSSSDVMPTGGGTDKIFYLNGLTVSSHFTIAATTNAISAGPITIASGITVSALGTWTIP